MRCNILYLGFEGHVVGKEGQHDKSNTLSGSYGAFVTKGDTFVYSVFPFSLTKTSWDRLFLNLYCSGGMLCAGT